MFRPLAIATLTVAFVAACSDVPTSPQKALANDGAARNAGTSIDQSANPLDLAIIGDVPYDPAAIPRFPALIEAINGDPKVRVAVHLGDIKSGSEVCSDARFQLIADDFTAFKDPLIYSIGDNEWTDCHRANNGGYDPINRLNKVRELFFANPGEALGGRGKRVEAQENYPENQLWVESRVTFSVLHIIGSNNGLDPWFLGAETPAQTAARTSEVAARQAANIAWLEHAFATAQAQGSLGIVLLYQADLWHPGDRAGGASFTAHTGFVTRLSQLAAGFNGPILLVSGDSHDYRVDVGVPWFSLYGVTAPANVTQIIVDRSIEADMNWLRLHVDPREPGVFSWEQVFVP